MGRMHSASCKSTACFCEAFGLSLGCTAMAATRVKWQLMEPYLVYNLYQCWTFASIGVQNCASEKSRDPQGVEIYELIVLDANGR